MRLFSNLASDQVAVCLMLGIGAVSPVLAAEAAKAHSQSDRSWLVLMRPQVVPDEADGSPLLQSGLSVRERMQANHERQQSQRLQRLNRVLAQSGVSASRTGSAGAALRLDLEPGQVAEHAIRRLRLHPDVQEVVPNERLRRLQATAVTPNDALWSQQWHLQAAATHAGAANLPAAWAQWTGQSKPVNVAVVDTGVRYDHPDLAGRLLPGYDFVSEVDYANDGDGRDADASDPGDWVTAAESRTALYAGCDPENSSWHGTVIAGEIAATAQNSVGVAGVNWGAQVVPVRVASKCGALLSDLLDGMRWAAGLPVVGAPSNPNPARVINLSYGGSGACNSAYQAAIDEVRTAGALVVVAAGNDASTLSRPADCQGVLTVTGVRADGAKSSYASYGSNVGLAAPGGSAVNGSLDAGILSTSNTGTRQPVAAAYDMVAGTSFSAPLVAGVASLVLGIQPTWTVAQLEEALKRTARAHTTQATLASCSPTVLSQGACNCTTAACGAGLLDASQAVAAALAALPPAATGGGGSGTGAGTGANPEPDTTDGGGGAMGWLWGLGLWAWVWGVARRRGRMAGA